jgi:hypothetical protein
MRKQSFKYNRRIGLNSMVQAERELRAHAEIRPPKVEMDRVVVYLSLKKTGAIAASGSSSCDDDSELWAC